MTSINDDVLAIEILLVFVILSFLNLIFFFIRYYYVVDYIERNSVNMGSQNFGNAKLKKLAQSLISLLEPLITRDPFSLSKVKSEANNNERDVERTEVRCNQSISNLQETIFKYGDNQNNASNSLSTGTNIFLYRKY